MMELPYRPLHEPLVAPGEIEHHVADMTATFSAELTLDQAQARLALHNQWLPVDGPGNESLGSLVSRNSTGTLRLGFGAWRDLMLGVQFRNGRRELITAGGRVVKNVAGYDLTRFMVGQGGVYGTIITLTTRTYRRPASALVAKFPPQVSLLGPLLTTPVRPQWAMLTADALLLGYLGDERAMNFYATTLPRYGPLEMRRLTLEQEIGVRRELWRPSTRPASGAARRAELRVSVPPSRIHQLADESRLTDWVADAAFGVVLCAVDAEQVDVVRQIARAQGGRVVALDNHPASLNDASAAERALLERLKQSFDPEQTLAPLT